MSTTIEDIITANNARLQRINDETALSEYEASVYREEGITKIRNRWAIIASQLTLENLKEALDNNLDCFTLRVNQFMCNDHITLDTVAATLKNGEAVTVDNPIVEKVRALTELGCVVTITQVPNIITDENNNTVDLSYSELKLCPPVVETLPADEALEEPTEDPEVPVEDDKGEEPETTE